MGGERGTSGSSVARLWARGVVGVASLALALLACYGLLALTALLPLIGVRLALDEGTWAATIVVLALLTVLAVLPGLRHHRSAVPAVAALAGGALILHALLVDYHVLVELAGFVLLAAAVAADIHLRRRTAGPGCDQAGGIAPGHWGARKRSTRIP